MLMYFSSDKLLTGILNGNHLVYYSRTNVMVSRTTASDGSDGHTDGYVAL